MIKQSVKDPGPLVMLHIATKFQLIKTSLNKTKWFVVY